MASRGCFLRRWFCGHRHPRPPGPMLKGYSLHDAASWLRCMRPGRSHFKTWKSGIIRASARDHRVLKRTLLPRAARIANIDCHPQAVVQGRVAHELKTAVKRHRPSQVPSQVTKGCANARHHTGWAAVRVGQQHQISAATFHQPHHVGRTTIPGKVQQVAFYNGQDCRAPQSPPDATHSRVSLECDARVACAHAALRAAAAPGAGIGEGFPHGPRDHTRDEDRSALTRFRAAKPPLMVRSDPSWAHPQPRCRLHIGCIDQATDNALK